MSFSKALKAFLEIWIVNSKPLMISGNAKIRKYTAFQFLLAYHIWLKRSHHYFLNVNFICVWLFKNKPSFNKSLLFWLCTYKGIIRMDLISLWRKQLSSFYNAIDIASIIHINKQVLLYECYLLYCFSDVVTFLLPTNFN